MHELSIALSLVELACEEAVDFNRGEAIASLRSIQPELPILELSCRSHPGITNWLNWLDARTVQESRGAQLV
jgi:hypothetical protein